MSPRSRLLVPQGVTPKPGVGATIDWSHPLASRLCFAALLNEWGATQCQNLVGQTQGVFTGSTKPSWVGGSKAGLSFPGGANTVGYLSYGAETFATDLGRDTSHPATYAFRMHPGAAGAGSVMGRNDGNTVSPGWQVSLGTTSVFFTHEQTAANRNTTVNTLPVNRWVTVVIVDDGSLTSANLRVYFDGVLQAHSADSNGSGSSGSDAAETLYIGRGNASFGLGNTGFAGSLDWVYLWKRMLSPAEVQLLSREPYTFIRDPAAIIVGVNGTIAPITGTGDLPIGVPTISGSGSVGVVAGGDIPIGAPAIAGTGSVGVTGTGALAIGAPALAGTGDASPPALARVTQVVGEVFAALSPVPTAHVTQVAAEVFGESPVVARVTQAALEVFGRRPEAVFSNGELIIGLTWIILTTRTGAQYVWADRPLPDPVSYYLGWKEPRALAWGKIVRALSNVLTGEYENAVFTVDLDDTDRLLRGLDETRELIGASVIVYMITDIGRRALETPRTVFRGKITDAQPTATLRYSLTMKDPYAEHVASKSPGPMRVFNQLDHPNCAQDKVPCSAEHYLVTGGIVMGSAAGYNADGNVGAGATTMAIHNGTGLFVVPQQFVLKKDPTVVYTVTSATGTDPETSIDISPALALDVTDRDELISGAAIAFVDSGQGVFAPGALFTFAGHSTVYTVSSSRLAEPELYLLFSPALTDDVAGGEAITVKASFTVPIALGRRVPVPYGVITDRQIIDGIDAGDGQGPVVYAGDRVLADGRTYGEFVWSAAACAAAGSPASPFQMLYFWNNPMDDAYTLYYGQTSAVDMEDFATEADADGRLAVPGYGNWSALGFTTSYIDYNSRRYTVLFLRGVFRDWALGILKAPDVVGGVPFGVNAYGCEAAGDGSGALIRRGLPQYLHILKNWLPPVGDCYQSGAWLTAPLYPDGTPMIDEASFAVADAQSGVYVADGFQGDFILFATADPVSAREVVARLNLSFGVQAGFNNKIQFSVHLVNTNFDATALADPLGYERDIFAGTFAIDATTRELFTAIAYQHTQDYFDRAAGGWRSTTSGVIDIENTDATTDYGAKTTYQTLSLFMLRGKNRSSDSDAYDNGTLTIDAVLTLTLARVSAIQHLPTLGTGPAGMNYELGDVVPITHYEGLTTAGWTDEPIRIERVEIDPSQFISGLEGYALAPILDPATFTRHFSLRVVDGSGGSPYAVGDVVPLVADPPPADYTFEEWTGGGGAVADPTDPTTTITMPAYPVTIAATYRALPVIPGASGFGMETRAAYGLVGTAPTVYRVTTLADSGAGSLRAALEASVPRVVLFETSGTISLAADIVITDPYLTVAGQTAPSPGITLRYYSIQIRTHDVLLQHLRLRPGWTGANCNSVLGTYPSASRIVLDHISGSWGQDENFYVYPGLSGGDANVTFWRCITAESLHETPGSLACSGGVQLEPGHGFLVTQEVRGVAMIQCLAAHNVQRNPYIQNGSTIVILNSVIFDWYKEWGIVFGSHSTLSGGAWHGTVIGNRFIRGPNTVNPGDGDYANLFYYINENNEPSNQIFRYDNTVTNDPDNKIVVEDNNFAYDPNVGAPPTQAPIPAGYTPLASTPVEAVVLAAAGARPLDRDAVDTRLVAEVAARTGIYPATQADVGGWPTLAVNTRALTTPASPHAVQASGYTALEEWLHGYAAGVE